MTKEEYSPEAQAVSDAANKAYWLWDEMCPADAHTIAVATLRAAVEQVAPDEPHPTLSQFWDDEADREWQTNQHFRHKLLAIADELDKTK
jgi:hypothetical protein